MHPTDLIGHAAFHDRHRDEEINTGLRITLDIDAGAVIVGEGEAAEEVAFYERSARHNLAAVIDALRRHAYRRGPVRAVPKPRRHQCDVCQGERIIVNPYSGERFRCPVCG